MANIFNYSVATNTGKGFITTEESMAFSIKHFPGDVYACADCPASVAWISKVSGTVKTLSEAQAVVDTAIAAAQAAWDELPEPTPGSGEGEKPPRPTAVALSSVPDLDTEATASGLTLTYINGKDGWTLK